MSVASRKKKKSAAARQARRREALRRLMSDVTPEVVTEIAKSPRPRIDERELRGAMRIAELRSRLKNLTPDSEDDLAAIRTDACAMGFFAFAREVDELQSREHEKHLDEEAAKLDEATRKRKENDAWSRRKRPQPVRQPPAFRGSNLHSSPANWPWLSTKRQWRSYAYGGYVLQRSWKHLASQLPTLTPTKGWGDLSEEEREEAMIVINAELNRRGVPGRGRR